MTTTQHTPGPWAVSPYMNITSRNGTVAKTEQMPGNDESEQKANAHLIAAAPKLLQVLKDLLPVFVDLYECFDPTGEIAVWDQWTQEALEVIAEAEGVK